MGRTSIGTEAFENCIIDQSILRVFVFNYVLDKLV